MAKKMWSFKTPQFIITWEIEKDPLDTSYMDASLAKECRQNVKSGKWKCFTSEISVTHRATKIKLGEAFLGGSIYENPADFRDHFGMNSKGHGSYFSQMVREAVEEARKRLPAVMQKLRDDIKHQKSDIARKQKALVALEGFEKVAVTQS